MSSASLIALLLGAAAATVAAAPAFVTGAYQDVSLDTDAQAPRIPGSAAGTLSWAFATGDCGAERWGPFDTAAFAALNVAEFSRAGRPYIVSTGGEAGAFNCGDAESMRRFVARYDSPLLVGIDFDIERQQTAAQIAALVDGAAALQRERPGLRFSFTLATHAAGDGSRRSLNATGERVMAALRAARFDGAVINLMVMNYGPAETKWCVLRGGDAAPACDMGRSALQAAANLHDTHGVPWNRIALTAMLGENDVAGNVFTPGDAQVLMQGARALGLAGVHYWSLGRDRPCPPGGDRVSARCHGLPGVEAGRFDRLLNAAGP